MRIHAGQQVLQDDWLWSTRCIERHPPRTSRLREVRRVEVPVERIEVAAGEGGVEALHTRRVLEHPLRDRGTDRDRDALVQRREISQAARSGNGPIDDRLDRFDDLADRRESRYRRERGG